MTPDQIELVKTTWAQVLPIQEQAATLTYGIVATVMKEATGKAAVAGGQAG